LGQEDVLGTLQKSKRGKKSREPTGVLPSGGISHDEKLGTWSQTYRKDGKGARGEDGKVREKREKKKGG